MSNITRETRLTTAMTDAQKNAILNELIRRTGGTTAGTVTLDTNAGTLNALVGKITTEALTTVAGAAESLVITNNEVAATDVVMVTRNGGTSDEGTPEWNVVVADGEFTIVLENRHASAAFDGTFIFAFQVIKIPV